MKQGEIQIIGIKVYKTKDGTPAFVVSYMTPYSDYDYSSSISCSGFLTGQLFTRSPLDGLQIGDIINPRYSVGYQGKAVFNGYDMVKPVESKK